MSARVLIGLLFSKLQGKNNKKHSDRHLVNDLTFLTNENQYYESADNENKTNEFDKGLNIYSNPNPTVPMSSSHFLKTYHNYPNVKRYGEDLVIPEVTSISKKVITPQWTTVPAKVTYVLSKESTISVNNNLNNQNGDDAISVSDSVMADFNNPIIRFSHSNIDNFPIYNFDSKTSMVHQSSTGVATASSQHSNINLHIPSSLSLPNEEVIYDEQYNFVFK